MLSITSRACASVPPDLREPSSAELKDLGFKFKIQRDEVNSSIDLRFPKNVRARGFHLVPHITDLVVRNRAGKEIARASNWVADNEFRSIVTSYDHKVSDLSVSVTYACARKSGGQCSGAIRFSIPSVSKFIDANPDVLNMRPRCRNISSMVIDCTDDGTGR